tara:strand:+ start:2959 stop:3234 length:276 start_codon:yes stop_codon:yes gene_type:complete
MNYDEPPDTKDKVTISEEAHRLYDLREEARRRGYTHIRMVEPEPEYDLEFEMSQYRTDKKRDIYIFAISAAIGGGMLAILMLGAVLGLVTN